jgi:predicted component of type VI protein secretion system
MFCDGMGIPHDGKGSVVGDLPKRLDAARLAETIDRLLGLFEPRLLTLYLHCFNLQVPGGWADLTAVLDTDPRLTLA